MPMLTTSVIGWPSAPRTRPSRTSAAKASILSRSALTAGATSTPSTRTGAPERSRSALCSAARRSVELTSSPRNIASRLAATLGRLGEREQQPQRLGVDPLLGEIVEEVAEDRVEALEASRIGGEEIGNRAGEQRGAPGGELGEDDRGRRIGHGLSLSGAALYALRPPPPRRACFYAAPIAIARHPPDARRRAASRRRRIVDRAGRAHRAGRPQRLGQVDAAAHRRGRSDRGRGNALRPAQCAPPLPAAGARSFRPCDDARLSSSPASARPTTRIAPAR